MRMVSVRLTSIVALLLLAGSSASAQAVQLPFSAQQGDEIAYRFEVEADDGTVIRNFSGTPVFTVTSVKPGQIALNVSQTHLKEEHKFKDPRTRGIIRSLMLGLIPEPRSLTIDERGRVVNQKGGVPLPYALGELALAVIEPRPADAQDSWEQTQQTTLTVSSSMFPRLRIADPTAKHLNAEEQTKFRVTGTTDQETTLERTYSFATIERTDDGPRYELTGKGDVKVSRKDGFVNSFDSRLTMIVRDDNSSDKTNIHLAFVRMTPEELKNYKTLMAAQAADRVAPPSPQERQEILDEIASGEDLRIQKALQKLAPKQPEAPDPELAAAVAKCLKIDRNFVQTAAAQALIHWATSAEAPALIESLANTNSLVANASEEALVALDYEPAIPEIMKRIKSPSSRIPASKALQKFGDRAEVPVHDLFNDEDRSVRMEAARILKEIGTQKSISLLEDRAANDADNTVKFLCKQALEAVKAKVKRST
ncbi:MAG: HEAT repeat domain-containing protein [Planctomycetaceae bacterium]|nr:HEAT repeat domain-containing protein [Planctomycetaceae bacterium]